MVVSNLDKVENELQIKERTRNASEDAQSAGRLRGRYSISLFAPIVRQYEIKFLQQFPGSSLPEAGQENFPLTAKERVLTP